MKYLTTASKAGVADGVAAQMNRRLSIWAYCKLNNIKYVHTPFFKVQHNYKKDKDFETQWETFFNLGDGELSLDDVDESELSYATYKDYYFNENGMDLYDKVIDEYREKYFKTEKPKLMYDENYINVAIHVRRGDIMGKYRFKKYGIGDEYYISVMKNLYDKLPKLSNKKIKFYVFSEYKTKTNRQIGTDLTTGRWGKYNKKLFDNFTSLDFNVELIVNQCPFSDFHHLVMSDILVTSKSYFSFIPAIIKKGRVIYHTWNHQNPKSYWEVNK